MAQLQARFTTYATSIDVEAMAYQIRLIEDSLKLALAGLAGYYGLRGPSGPAGTDGISGSPGPWTTWLPWFSWPA